jgi:phosphoglycolate phosphatase
MSVNRPAILFDLDGVLVDSRTPISSSLNHALVRVGVAPFPAVELHRLIGPPLHEAFLELLGRRGADPALAEPCVAAYRECYAEASLTETRAFDGVPPVLEALGRTHALAVATSKPAEFACPILETLGLAHHFRAVVGPPLRPEGEAKRHTVRRALDALGLAGGADTALVGDRRHDVEAGRAHGLRTVGVTWGIGDVTEHRAAGADHLVGTPEELLHLFASSGAQ